MWASSLLKQLRGVGLNILLPDETPALGFEHPPSVSFSHDLHQLFPTANTCSLTFTLPTCSRIYEEFKTKITFGIFNTVGFGQI